jgi:outer membrane beta-barrel protein
MRRNCLAIAVASWVVLGWGVTAPASVAAQDMTFDEEEATAEGEASAEGEAGAEGDADMSFGEGDADAEADTGASGDGGDLIGDLAIGQEDQASTREAAPRRTETVEEIYAVQQIYALRINRVELAPSVGFSLNDPYVSHPSVGIALNYWWTNVLAIGLNFNWYQGLETESDLNFFVRRSTRLAIPITEYQLGANLNFTYVPLYGKFMMFNEYIFQWDAYIVGGVGIMRTRPVAVVDPEVRQFEFDWRIAFNAGIGIRVFITRWLAVFGELRDYAYLERLENLDVALPNPAVSGSACPNSATRCDPNTWTAESVSFENNVTAHIGLTIFLPFDFDYALPK